MKIHKMLLILFISILFTGMNIPFLIFYTTKFTNFNHTYTTNKAYTCTNLKFNTKLYYDRLYPSKEKLYYDRLLVSGKIKKIYSLYEKYKLFSRFDLIKITSVASLMYNENYTYKYIPSGYNS
jgi:hypothetical protein